MATAGDAAGASALMASVCVEGMSVGLCTGNGPLNRCSLGVWLVLLGAHSQTHCAVIDGEIWTTGQAG